MIFKVGEKVVCIKKGVWSSEYFEENVTYPRYGDELTIRAIDDGGYLRFKEIINPKDYYISGFVEPNFHPCIFRKLDNNSTSKFKSNSVSKQLAKQAKEYNPMEVPEHTKVEI